ncbi:MAG: DUF3606 domain-containing protein [Rhodospirillales bacterium]|nr:DUF3606 domain-containing protein [Rhodospirillales bacterium]
MDRHGARCGTLPSTVTALGHRHGDSNVWSATIYSHPVKRLVTRFAPNLQDRSRIDVNEKHEVRYWTQKRGISEEQLATAVKKVGVSIDAVARELGHPSKPSPPSRH